MGETAQERAYRMAVDRREELREQVADLQRRIARLERRFAQIVDAIDGRPA